MQPAGVLERAQRVHVLVSGELRERARAPARGDQQVLVRQLGAVRQREPVRRHVESARGDAEQELDAVVLVPARASERELLRRGGFVQCLLGQRRPVVWAVRLCARHADPARVAASAQRLGAALAREPAAGDDHTRAHPAALAARAPSTFSRRSISSAIAGSATVRSSQGTTPARRPCPRRAHGRARAATRAR